MALRAASRSGPGYPRWASNPLAVDGGHEQALAPLLVLFLVRAVRGAFIGVLIPLHLALEAVKDRPDRLLARGMAGDDVEELLSGSRALTSQLMDQGLIGSLRKESSYDIGVGDIRQLVALSGEVFNIPTKSFPGLLSAVFEILWVLRTRMCALKVSHKDIF